MCNLVCEEREVDCGVWLVTRHAWTISPLIVESKHEPLCSGLKVINHRRILNGLYEVFSTAEISADFAVKGKSTGGNDT